MGSDTGMKFSFTTFVRLDDVTNSSGVYGQVSAINTAELEPDGVYGQVSAINTAELEPDGVYGQVSVVSGDFPSVLQSNIPGLGDIIYYGENADINLDSATFQASFNNEVQMSGVARPTADYTTLSLADSEATIIGASGTAILPSSELGVYYYFANQEGLDLTISGVNQFVTSNGLTDSISVSGVGSHVGLLGIGTRWLATEESGVM